MSGPGVPLGKDGIRPGDVPALALGSGLPGDRVPGSQKHPCPTTPAPGPPFLDLLINSLLGGGLPEGVSLCNSSSGCRPGSRPEVIKRSKVWEAQKDGEGSRGEAVETGRGAHGPQIQDVGTLGTSKELEVLRLLLWARGVPTDPLARTPSFSSPGGSWTKCSSSVSRLGLIRLIRAKRFDFWIIPKR